MIEKPNIPKFESEAEEAEWWYQHREETAQWMEEAAAAGQTTTLANVLERAMLLHEALRREERAG
ncbi:MAG: hypothetical protein ABSH49_01005 [Bryobacteraceae bacterium]|jgi:hypothetical protein